MSGRCDRFASLVPRPARRQRCVMRISTWKRSTSGDARLVGETASSRASREPGAPLAAQVSESGPGGLCLRLDAKFPAEHELELVVLNELDEAARDGVLADSMLTLPPFRPRSRAISGSVPPMPRPLRRAIGARWRRVGAPPNRATSPRRGAAPPPRAAPPAPALARGTSPPPSAPPPRDPPPACPCPASSTPGPGPGGDPGSGKNCLSGRAVPARSRSLARARRPEKSRTVTT